MVPTKGRWSVEQMSRGAEEWYNIAFTRCFVTVVLKLEEFLCLGFLAVPVHEVTKQKNKLNSTKDEEHC